MWNCVCDGLVAVGCPDMKTPSNGWLKRNTNQMTAGCVTSQVTWTLDCVGTEWRGTAFNCSLGPSLRFALLFAASNISSMAKIFGRYSLFNKKTFVHVANGHWMGRSWTGRLLVSSYVYCFFSDERTVFTALPIEILLLTYSVWCPRAQALLFCTREVDAVYHSPICLSSYFSTAIRCWRHSMFN